MSVPVLVLGKSGSGKSTAIKSLPPKETFLFNVCNKELPFRGANKMYKEFDKSCNGNMLSTDDYDRISNAMSWLAQNKGGIKYIVIDDSQYLMVNEFMRKHSSAGKGNGVFLLYNEIGDHFWKLIMDCKHLPDNVFIFFLHHTETNDSGEIKAKTIGKMIDEKVDLPGMFTCVLLAQREESENYFLTQNNGMHPAKTPQGMFDSLKINNDLLLVANTINSYNEKE